MNKDFYINPKLIIFLIIIFPLLFIWQGLDFTDIGYSLTNYQQIFNDPESVTYSFIIWLTNIIGGIWILLFGDTLGLLGANIAGVLVIYLTIGLSYLLLKPYINRKYLLIGIFLTMIYTKGSMLLNYNKLTALFFMASAFFLINGLKGGNIWKILVSGLIMGLNIFIRLPNILGFSLILSIFFYGYISKAKFLHQVKQAIYFIAGYILAILLVIFTMKILGHYGIFKDSIKMIMGIASDRTGHHSIISLGMIYIGDYLKVIALSCSIILFAFIVSKFFSLFKKRYPYYGFIVILSIMIIIIASLAPQQIYGRTVFMILGVLYAILLVYIVNIEKSDYHYRLISFVALLILIITPLGSNNGLRNSIHSMWLPFPIAFAYIFELRKIGAKFETESNLNSTQWKIDLNSRELGLFRNFLVTLFVVFSLVWSFAYTYRDSSNRIEMRYTVEHPRLRGVFTTKERAKVVQELLDETSKYIKEDDYLLAYNSIPMLHFLTKTRPYLYNSWPDSSPPYQFKQALAKAIKEKTQLPILVRAKFNTREFYWPRKNIVDTTSEIQNENRATIDDFINRNNYTLVWENDFFEILKP